MNKPVDQCPTGCCTPPDLVCTCEFYANWKIRPRQRIDPWVGREARQFRDGHRAGRADACRRIWPHLDPEGRQLAAAIAAEGDS